MTPRSARLLAVPAMLGAFALSLVSALWVQPWSLRIGPDDLSTLADAGSHLVSGAGPLAIYVVVTRSARRRPAGLRPDFSVEPSPHWAGPLAMILGWTAGWGWPTDHDPAGAFAWSSIAVIMLALVAATVALLGNRPRLALDPAGLTLQNLIRRTRLGWADLVPGHPVPPAHRETRHLLVRLPSAARTLRTGDLHVDPAFLAFTIRQYIAEPGHREAIGTAAERSRLELAFPASGGQAGH